MQRLFELNFTLFNPYILMEVNCSFMVPTDIPSIYKNTLSGAIPVVYVLIRIREIRRTQLT
jgi:hypothetical protein